MPRHCVARAVVCCSCAIPRTIMPVRRDLEESVHMNRKPRLHGEKKKAIAVPSPPTRSQDAVGNTGPQPLRFSAVRELQRPATPSSLLQMSPVLLCLSLLSASAAAAVGIETGGSASIPAAVPSRPRLRQSAGGPRTENCRLSGYQNAIQRGSAHGPPRLQD